ncbi:MAG: hypothetical protein HOY69_00120 [Streptomyces sp.]|nr:hypothetical protein [Streptomyces sp.]
MVESTADLESDHGVGPLVGVSGTVTSGPFTGHAFHGSFTAELSTGAAGCSSEVCARPASAAGPAPADRPGPVAVAAPPQRTGS